MADAIGWLIVRGTIPDVSYFRGWEGLGPNAPELWTRNVNLALRNASEANARERARGLRDEGWRVEEHIWTDAGRRTPLAIRDAPDDAR